MDVFGPREVMLMRLLQIHDNAEGEDTDAGAIVATLEGYISGVSQLFTPEIDEASHRALWLTPPILDNGYAIGLVKTCEP